MNIGYLSQITAFTGGDYGAKAEIERLQERRGELLGKLQSTVQDEPPGTAASSIKDIAKDLREVDDRYLETQLQEQTRQIEAEGQKNLQEIARKERQRQEAQQRAGDRAGVVFSGSLTKLMVADNRAGALPSLKEPEAAEAVKPAADNPAKDKKDTLADVVAGQKQVYDSREAYEGRKFMRLVDHETKMINANVTESVEMGIAEAADARRARQEKLREEERERLGLVPQKGFRPGGINIQV